MQGDVLGQMGGEGNKSFVITFEVTPTNATLVVKDENSSVVEPITEKTYRLKVGTYTYSASAADYQSVENIEFKVVKDEVINVKLIAFKTVTFKVTPTNATFVLKDGNSEEIQSTSSSAGSFTYKLESGKTYYYTASAPGFTTKNNQSVLISESTSTINIELVQGTLFGVKRSLSNTTTTWERIENSDGMVANATHNGESVRNDFDSIAPWKDIRSCDVSANGTVNAYIGDATYDPKSPKGYIMTEIPEFWYKREQSGGYEYIYISSISKSGYVKSEKFYIGRYTAGGTSSAITCKSGIENLVSISIVDFRTAAKKIGSKWGQLDILRWSIIQMLYLVEYADYDSQKVLGNGVSNGSKINTGGCDDLKMKSGSLIDDQKHAVIYRGIENVFGNIYQWCDGINFSDSQAWVCTDPTKYESDKFASPYTKLGWTCPSSDGYIKEVGYDANFPALQLTKTTGGSSSTYIPDYSSYDSGSRVLRVGGYYSRGASCGLWYFYWYSSSSSTGSSIGGRLLFTPA